jgi:hypothetical protein
MQTAREGKSLNIYTWPQTLNFGNILCPGTTLVFVFPRTDLMSSLYSRVKITALSRAILSWPN